MGQAGLRARKAHDFQNGHKISRLKVGETAIKGTTQPLRGHKKVVEPSYYFTRLSNAAYHRTVHIPGSIDEPRCQSNITLLWCHKVDRSTNYPVWAPPEVDDDCLVHMSLFVRALHEAMAEHQGTCEPSNSVSVAVAWLEEKRGVDVSGVFGCSLSEYKNRKYKLYNEIKQKKPGQNPSEINQSLQLGLLSTSITTAWAPRPLSCLSMPSSSASPRTSGMQKSC